MAYDAEARHKTYRATKKKREESDERNIQNKMRYNQTHDQQRKVDAASDRNVQNQMRYNQTHNQQSKIDEDNERKIRNQMRYDSNHDRQLIRDDKDEANIRRQMRQNSALSNNSDYNKYNDARKRGEKKAAELKKNFNAAVDTAKRSVSKKGAGYQQQNPTASGGGYKGGQMDREWKNHKWTSRERSESGKWMYEYGGGTSSGVKPSVKNKSGKEVTRGKKPAARYQERNDFEKAMTKAHDAVRNTGANLNRAFRDLSNAASDVVQNGANFLNNLFK